MTDESLNPTIDIIFKNLFEFDEIPIIDLFYLDESIEKYENHQININYENGKNINQEKRKKRGYRGIIDDENLGMIVKTRNSKIINIEIQIINNVMQNRKEYNDEEEYKSCANQLDKRCHSKYNIREVTSNREEIFEGSLQKYNEGKKEEIEEGTKNTSIHITLYMLNEPYINLIDSLKKKAVFLWKLSGSDLNKLISRLYAYNVA
ncbi:hypothetical protein PIROE2DRAFT_9666 [Piromyces sp. E2]|nr:hypothetical protein PIROE2DRAFT_9666 [Piromyces sp. E2]|eukprot:OUM63728.1 hypothetical protein PIROE2DRAFT_9666 [Piromyces sp. E2]